MLVSAGVVLVTVGVGLPVAWRLAPTERRDPAQVLGAAAAVGLMANILAGLALVRSGLYSQVTLVGSLLVFVAVTTSIATRARAGWRTRLAQVPRSSWLALVPVLVTFVIPKQPTYFVFQTGDMGDYVNSANVAADTGSLVGGFPHGFTVLLANVHLIFGEAVLDSLTPALGAIFVLGLVAAARALGAPLVPVIAISLLAAVNPVTVWFSVFPASETLYAALLLGMTVLVAVARQHESDVSGLVLASLAGAAAGVLLLVRGNAMLLLPVIAIMQLISWVADDERRGRVQACFSFAAIACLGAAYAYDVRFLPQYFVQNQLGGQLSQSTFDRLGSYQLLGPSLVLAVAMAVGVTAWGLVLWLMDRRRPPSTSRRLVVRVAIGAAVLATLVYVIASGSGSTVDGVGRWGFALLLLTVLGIGTLVLRPAATVDLVAWGMPIAIGLAGVGLYARRVSEASNHAYFLYWDRYLVSEAFPIALLLAVAGGTLIWSSVERLNPTLSLPTMAAIAVLGSAPVLPTTALATEHRLFGDAYDELESIADSVPARAPIVYLGIVPPPTGWFFPNTFRAMGTPLTQTYDRRVLNLPTDPFAPDPVPDFDEVVRLIADDGRSTGYLFAVRAAGDGPMRAAELDAGATLLRSEDYRVWILPRRVDRDEEEFRAVDLVLDLYRVEIEG